MSEFSVDLAISLADSCHMFDLLLNISLTNIPLHSISQMASGEDWSKLIKARYPSYKVEVEAFLDSLSVSNSTELSIAGIFDAIKYEDHVDDNLKLLYGEAVMVTDTDVKARIKSHVSNFKRALK